MVELFNSRIVKLRRFLNKKGIQSFLITGDENILYLTGFYGKDSGGLLLLTVDSIYLLVHFIYLEQAKKSIPLKNINIICYRKNKFGKLAEILDGYSSKNLMLEGKNISFADFNILKKLLSGHKKKLVSVEGMVEKLRVIKDELEIVSIKKACRTADKVYKDIINLGASGISIYKEIELAYKMEDLMINNNSSGKSFDIIVAYDKNSSIPHYNPGNNKIKKGLILMDFGCRFENYCSDITRTFFIGSNKISNEFKKIYDIVLEAQLTAIRECREGIVCCQLDRTARKFIESKGYGDNFGHGLGHGVGLEIHEDPVISTESKVVLKENMVITIEPGVYIENFGGVRIEDMVLVKKNGCEILTRSNKVFFIPDRVRS